MRILYVTTVGTTMGFFTSLVSELVASGDVVEIATNDRDFAVPDVYTEMGCAVHTIDCERSPLKPGNLRAIRQLRELTAGGAYDIIHCHTPIAAACTRIACRRTRKKGTKVVYTAHGFHFFKGSPLKNWLIYYPVEWVCSWMTDVLVCITQEDFDRARKRLHARRVEYVPGVGVDLSRFEDIDGARVRNELGLAPDDMLLLSIGELNRNKNHQVVVRALAQLPANVHYAVAGRGDQGDALVALAKELGVGDRYHMLGFRDDVPELMAAADAYVLPSMREGLNVSLMEAMASGLPCAVSKIRGNVDLIDDDSARFDPRLVVEVLGAVKYVLGEHRGFIGKRNRERIGKFGMKVVNSSMLKLYAQAIAVGQLPRIVEAIRLWWSYREQ